MQKIITIGGGTGHYQLLRGLKNYDCKITAVVNMADNGGSSGKLRDEYGVLPPGDLRQCIVALARGKKSRILSELFKYRFEKDHNLGNLIVTALTDICGSHVEGIKEAEKLLNIKGKVLPVTIDNVTLMAETDKGILEGESKISSHPGKISDLSYKPSAFLYGEAADAIRQANKIVICPGDLYGSILPNFKVQGMKEVLQNSKAKIIYVCNLFTKEGTYDFKAGDFVAEIERYANIKLDHVIINNQLPSEELIKKYLSEKSKFVEDDLKDNPKVIRGNLVGEYSSEPKTILRHIPEKVAHKIISI